jgi:threonylcarbamoyladenosine tRNA methylthiotransferase MtaB
MPQLESSVIKLRARVLREEGEHVKLIHLKSRVGTKDFALFEETGYGRLPDFTLVKVDNPPKAGNIAKIHITGIDSNKLIGKLI